MTFPCGHPRTPENISANGRKCRLCQRIRAISKKAEHDQRRINEGRFYTIGERIARGGA